MKKYKHKTLSYTAVLDTDNQYYIVSKNDTQSNWILKELIENSNDWEVVEKDYEILEFTCNIKEHKVIIRKNKAGEFESLPQVPVTEADLIASPMHDITKVRSLTSGLSWSVGDETINGIITNFNIIGDGKMIADLEHKCTVGDKEIKSTIWKYLSELRLPEKKEKKLCNLFSNCGLYFFGRHHTDFKIPVTTFTAPKDSWYQITWQEDGCDPKTESKYLKAGDIIKVNETLIYIVQLDKPEAPKEENTEPQFVAKFTQPDNTHLTLEFGALVKTNLQELRDKIYNTICQHFAPKEETKQPPTLMMLPYALHDSAGVRDLKDKVNALIKDYKELWAEKTTLTEIVTQQAKQIQNLEAENQNLKEYIKLHKMFRNL